MRRLWFILIFCVFPLSGGAQTYPDPISPFVNDFAQLLDAEDKAEVRSLLSSLKADTGIEMTVVTLDSQAPYAPNESLEAFATNLFNNWGIGDATRNDGILILVLREDRAMRIELGRAYGQAWNDEAGRVIERSFLPSFRSDQYAKGIKKGVSDVVATLARPFAKGQSAPEKPTNWTSLSFLMIFLLVFFQRKLRDLTSLVRRCPSCGYRGSLRVSRQITSAATKAMQGSGQKSTRCNRCDYTQDSTFIISRKSSSSSFGGGQSGGGGASGRW